MPGPWGHGAQEVRNPGSRELELQFWPAPLSQLNFELLLANFAAAENISRD